MDNDKFRVILLKRALPAVAMQGRKQNNLSAGGMATRGPHCIAEAPSKCLPCLSCSATSECGLSATKDVLFSKLQLASRGQISVSAQYFLDIYAIHCYIQPV